MFCGCIFARSTCKVLTQKYHRCQYVTRFKSVIPTNHATLPNVIIEPVKLYHTLSLELYVSVLFFEFIMQDSGYYLKVSPIFPLKDIFLITKLHILCTLIKHLAECLMGGARRHTFSDVFVSS